MRGISSVAAVALITVLGLPGVLARAEPARVASGPGTITVTGLHPGDEVSAYAWPSLAVTTRYPDRYGWDYDGPDTARYAADHRSDTLASVRTTLLSTTTADASGVASSALVPAAGTLSSDYVEPDGAVRTELEINHGAAIWVGDSDQLPADGLLPASSFASSPAPDIPRTCAIDITGWEPDGWHYGIPEKYITAYPRPHAVEHVGIHVGSSHAISVALNLTGTQWTASGSVSIESQDEVGASDSWSYPKYVYNKVNLHQYKRECWADNPVQPGDQPFWQYQAAAEEFADFFSFALDAPNPSNAFQWCYPHHKNWELQKSAGNNRTFDAGVTLFGIGLHVHAVYSSGTTAHWGQLTGTVEMCATYPSLQTAALVAARYFPNPPPGCYPPPGPCAVVNQRAS